MANKNQLLSWAAYSANFEILQIFLRKDDDVDQLQVAALFGAPPLHHAVEGRAIVNTWTDSRNFDDYLHCNDFISIRLLEKKLREKNLDEDNAITKINKNEYSAREACAKLLLHAGADILTTDECGRMADPGAMAPNEAQIWWYKLVATEIINIKNDLNVAGNGTAIVASLVATASFVGPLQPPLNYVAIPSETAIVDVGVQVTETLIKIFIISNSLSFYFAIASIMFAIMPSLQFKKEALMSRPCDNLRRSRMNISMAVGLLVVSISSVLISFVASSLVVIPLQHRRLVIYSMVIGGLYCYIGLTSLYLYFVKLFLLMFTKK